MRMIDRARRSLAGYDRRILDSNPMAAYAKLHLVAPVALAAMGLFILTGSVLPVERYREDAGSLITAAAPHREYAALVDRYETLGDRPAEQRRVTESLQDLAVAAKLRHCHTGSDYAMGCDGRDVHNRALVVQFWIGLVTSALFLVFWFYFQLRDSWMLPRWSFLLWYTPIYATLIGLVTCGPFLMAAVYYARASADYHMPPSRFVVAQPTLLLYLVLLLQLTAIAVGCLKSRAAARSFAIGAAMIALGVLIVVQLQLPLLSGSTSASPTRDSLGISTVLLACLVALSLWHRANLAGGGHRTSTYVAVSVGELSRGLIPAWLLLVLHSCVLASGVDVGWISAGLAGAGFAGCLYYVLRSQADELGLNRRKPAAEA